MSNDSKQQGGAYVRNPVARFCSCFWYWGFSNKVFLKNKVPQKKKKKKKKLAPVRA